MAALRVELDDGTRLRVRQITPDDRDALRAAFEGLSEESRYRRFFSPKPELSTRDLDYLTEADHRDHEALVALDEATGEWAGVARFVRTDVEEAEPAIAVGDAWQGRGVGTRLIQALSDRAREEGISRFRAPVLAENEAAIRVLRGLGESRQTQSGREVELDVELTPKEAAGPRLAALLRAVATDSLAPGMTFLQRLTARPEPGPVDPAELENTVVVGTDESVGGSVAAMGRAAELAEALGAGLELVATRRPLRDDPADVREALEDAARLLRARGLRVDVQVRRGSRAAALLDVAAERRARLIVVPAGERTGAGRLLGVANAVARQTPCNVLIVR